MNRLTMALAAALFLLLMPVAYAQPVAIDAIFSQTPERKPSSSGGIGIPSEDGNTTQMDINGTQITQHWQGYYGNISGEITLDDADSNTLFSWRLASVSGEIFAVNTTASVQWGNITCVNLTNATGTLDDMNGATKINGSTLNQQYFIAQEDEDDITGTFNYSFGGSITIGAVAIDSTDACPTAYLNVNNQSQTTDYVELLLFDNASALVFGTIIEPDTTVGFDSKEWNFQMIVPQENASVGTYYFYVELS